LGGRSVGSRLPPFARRAYFPVGALITVSRFARPGMLIEIQRVAV
jgi:hypothetical protein